jgi:hypothetical protein
MTLYVVTTDNPTSFRVGTLDQGPLAFVPSLGSGATYTPSVPANWPPPVPSTVQDAIDALAAVVGPTVVVKGTFTNNNSGVPVVLVSVALTDSFIYRVVFTVYARNVGAGLYKKKSSQEWYRAGGAATLLSGPPNGGGEDGPVPVDNTLGITGASLGGNVNSLEGRFGGNAGFNMSGYWELGYQQIAMPAAS